MSECAVAIFVKTPGLSPIKTRLAERIGVDNAVCFYELSCRATASVVRRLALNNPIVVPYWAVAESAGVSHKWWSSYKQIVQEEGDLGRRLSGIYRMLYAYHKHVILIGADMPHLQENVLEQAVLMLTRSSRKKLCENDSRIVIGPTEDGGFYLFGSNLDLPGSFWEGISYGTELVYKEILLRAQLISDVCMLPFSFDVDVSDDLKKLHRVLLQLADPTPALQDILHWLEMREQFQAGMCKVA